MPKKRKKKRPRMSEQKVSVGDKVNFKGGGSLCNSTVVAVTKIYKDSVEDIQMAQVMWVDDLEKGPQKFEVPVAFLEVAKNP